MAAPKGNEYWKLRSTDGRCRDYETAEELANKANEYFTFCIDNPLKQEQLFHSQGVITKGTVNVMRAFTIGGLCNYLDISEDTFKNYEKVNKEFLGVTTRIRQIIYNQKFEGAAANLLNSNLIAMELGLKSKTENTNTNLNTEMTEDEREKIIKETYKMINDDE